MERKKHISTTKHGEDCVERLMKDYEHNPSPNWYVSFLGARSRYELSARARISGASPVSKTRN